MRQRSRTLVAIGSVAALTVGGTVAVIGSASAAPDTSLPKTALGLSSNGKNLTVFSLKTAQRTKALGRVKGLSGDTILVGIDQRPQDHRFYGVGDKGGVYRISISTTEVKKVSQLTVPLQGKDFDIDFNPAADRLRIVSDTGQNLRHDITNTVPATANDGALNYPVGTPPAPGPAAPGITAAAYTNNDLDAKTGTTLFDLDSTLDQIVQQVPANSGTLLPSGTVSPRRGPIAGLDIVSTLNRGRTVANTAFAATRPTKGGAATLYRVDLLSGKFTKVAQFNKDIADIAIPQP